MARTFKQLCTLFEKLENTAGRLEMTSLMCDFLKQCDIDEIQMISYLVQGRVAPTFVDSEFNYSEKSMINLLTEYFQGQDISVKVNSIRQKSGDIGDTLFEISKNLIQSEESRSIKEVYELLWSIVNTSGTGSVERKGNLIIKFLTTTSDIEMKYFTRIVCGSLRLGLHSKTMIDVFSYVVTGDKQLSDEFGRVYGVSADIGYVANKLDDFDKKTIEKELADISITPGFPVLSRLVERVGTFEEVIERLGDQFLVQGKFDGLRLQIHKYCKDDVSKREVIWRKYLVDSSQGLDLFGSSQNEDIVVKLYTRNLEDVTDMFPEIVEDVRDLSYSNFILDSEVLGWDYSKDTFLSYQLTMQRKRKYEVGSKKKEIPVKAIIFDILYFNSSSLVNLDTEKRIQILEENFGDLDNSIKVADTKKMGSVDELQKIFKKNIDKGLEGVIVKQLKGGYSAGKRNFEWIKLKKSMERGLIDTLDMVIVGYYYGSGRRADLGIGALLGAVYNEDKDRYDAICKIGTGISDDLFKKIHREIKGFETLKKTKDVVVADILKPDVWIKPHFVITVDADEITRDIGKSKKSVGNGLSLRFPRLVEWDRQKGVENITTVEELTRIYEAKNIK